MLTIWYVYGIAYGIARSRPEGGGGNMGECRYHSLANLAGEGWSGQGNSSRGGRQSERGGHAAPPSSASWAENTIMTEGTQESLESGFR
jgi:hypothetical protein